MPKDINLNKILVIGSGPIVIGQAAEFDYAGTQACRALKEEGIETILVNSNPATIMSDEGIADKIYLQPLNIECLEYIIKKERPDGLLATLGGQTGLNLAIELYEKGILQKYGVRLLGTTYETIQKAEDRESFKSLMDEISEPVAKSVIVSNVDDGVQFANQIGYPVVIRPAYTLGGTGGGIAYSEEEFCKILHQGLNLSPIHQALIEESVAGYKEIEFEVIRDSKDNCVIVCDMENFDPVGIHTGDSIVVAPSQTISQEEYLKLKQASVKIIKALKIEGGCNIQFALNPNNGEYVVIEVNPRVSRSSALASKAAGYPIAKITTKIAIGLGLDEISNSANEKTYAEFEPKLDYIIVKIPKWPFDKFVYANKKLGTQMKATGEVMAIDKTFESAFLKALICLEGQKPGLRKKKFDALCDEDLFEKMKNPEDKRIYAIASAIRRGISLDKIYELTKIDKWFLVKIKNIIDVEKRLKTEKLNAELLHTAESMGYVDDEICTLSSQPLEILDTIRRAHDMYPVHKKVNACQGKLEKAPSYYYSTYEAQDENTITNKEKVIVIGSGPIRIGQGIEFDYSCVHGIEAIKENGFESIIINNNPETVSTDFDISDKLYFEPLYVEDVFNVIRKEMPKGAIVQFGGQTALNLAPKLLKRGIQILGTTVESINVAEDRKRFEMLLSELGIKQPKGRAVANFDEAKEAADELGYPVVVRPSYVTGGRAMKVIYDEAELSDYIKEAVSISPEYPVSVDKYIEGIEFEIDAICDKENIIIPGIMEHIERTGIHSGDSFFVYPHRSLSDEIVQKVIECTKKISKALQICGLMNIQFVLSNNEIYVIEVNPRASRTVPIMSKITKIPMVKLAVDLFFGKKLQNAPYKLGLADNKGIYAVKAPVFSFQKLSGVDPALGAEMKSTGEVLGVDTDYHKALIKAFMGAGYKFEGNNSILISLKKKDKKECLEIVKKMVELGFKIYATNSTSEFLAQNGIENQTIDKNDTELILSKLKSGEISMILNTPTKGKDNTRAGFKIRTGAIQFGRALFSSLDTIQAYLEAFEYYNKNDDMTFDTIDDYLKTNV